MAEFFASGWNDAPGVGSGFDDLTDARTWADYGGSGAAVVNTFSYSGTKCLPDWSNALQIGTDGLSYFKIDTTYNDYAYPSGLGLTMQTWFDDAAISAQGWIGGQ